MEDCIFCKIANKEIPAGVVFENDDLMAFRDSNPMTPVHILVIPKKHIATIDDIEKADTLLAGEMIMAAQKIARDIGISQDGYRLVFNVKSYGGQKINHIHLHLLGGGKLKEKENLLEKD